MKGKSLSFSGEELFRLERLFLKSPLKSIENAFVKKIISVILEEFYNCLKHRKFGKMAEIWVTNWQPCLFLHSAVNCFHNHSSWCKSSNNIRNTSYCLLILCIKEKERCFLLKLNSFFSKNEYLCCIYLRNYQEIN